jgi:ABC-type transport system involved in cytochrome bd biosynthesis fused ATPase/permease subunit
MQRNLTANIYLLDEWDANLDRKNREDISKVLDEIAKKACVIEILHTR